MKYHLVWKRTIKGPAEIDSVLDQFTFEIRFAVEILHSLKTETMRIQMDFHFLRVQENMTVVHREIELRVLVMLTKQLILQKNP